MRDDRCDLLCLDLPLAAAVRARVPDGAGVEAAAARAQALADPTRLRIAWALAEGGELCVCDLAWVAGLAQNLVSHHVRRLRGSGLAVSRREGRLMLYRLTEQGSGLLAALNDTTEARVPNPRDTAAPGGPAVYAATSTVEMS